MHPYFTCLLMANQSDLSFFLFRGFSSIPNLGSLPYHVARHIEVKIPSSHTNHTKVLPACNDNLNVESFLARRR
jgi:hypothetical protein